MLSVDERPDLSRFFGLALACIRSGIGVPVLANLTERATVLSPESGRVVTFDREGRWIYYIRRGQTFKRSLGSQVHLRFRRQVRQRCQLSHSAAMEVFAEVYGLAHELAAMCQGEVLARLQNEVLHWSPESLAKEEERFSLAYRPITILPPDQYLSIVLQATEGCTWNHCTFCNFFMDRPFRVRSTEDFEEHTQRVRELLGQGLLLRRGIFLADGNALALSFGRLEPLVDLARRYFPNRELFGFVDLFSGERRRYDEWRALRERGLRRVYVGMESGLDELLELVNKPGSAADLENFVATLKRAGLQVSLIIMVGLGGHEYRCRHGEATRDLLLQLPLQKTDLVYLSPFVEHKGSSYHERRVRMGLTPLTEIEVESEVQRLAKQLRGGGLKVSRYDIREFVY